MTDYSVKKDILIVDDEEMIRELLSDIVSTIGYQSTTAIHGRHALDTLAVNQKIGLMILDLNMPVMDGKECYTELRKIDTELPIIFSSGMDEADTRRLFPFDEHLYFIQKPYTLPVITSLIKGILGD